jgi:hypothetical protein
MTAPTLTTTEARPTLELLSSDHPRFRAGAPIAAIVEQGQLVQLSLYTVYHITLDPSAGRVVIQTAQEYLFVVTAASYDALLAASPAGPPPRWLYSDKRLHYYAAW